MKSHKFNFDYQELIAAYQAPVDSNGNTITNYCDNFEHHISEQILVLVVPVSGFYDLRHNESIF